MTATYDYNNSILERSPELSNIIDEVSEGKSKDLAVPIEEWTSKDFAYLYHLLLSNNADESEVWCLIDELYKFKYGGLILQEGGD